jgi:hypothetical protein
MPRPVESRIATMRRMRPPRRGLCARTVWLACGGNATGLDHLPALGVPSATAATYRIRNAGELVDDRASSAPRGSIMLWTGGSRGHGHASLSLGTVGGVHRTLTVDALGLPVADVPTAWIARNWGNLRWAGWTTWYGEELPPLYPGAPIRPGQRSKAVAEVQRRLRVRTTGLYGEATLAAVVRFQKARPWLWPADGVIGPKSYAAILRQN